MALIGQGDLFRFVIADINGVEQAEVVPSNPIWSEVLNDAGAASFVMPLRHPLCTRTLFQQGASELHIYYGQNRVWGGHLYGAEASTSDDTVRFGFEGFFSRLKHRYVDVTRNYNNVDQFDIAWGLISYTQGKTNGNLGMNWTRGSATPSGVTRDINYPFWERTIIADAILDLAELNNGFDFQVTPNKTWTTYYPSRGAVKTIPLELGKNVQTWAMGEDATDTANAVSAIGAGDGKNTCIAVASSATNQAALGLMERADSFTEIKRYAQLNDKATEIVRQRKAPRLSPSITLYPTQEPGIFAFNPGDRITLRAHEGYIDFERQMRCIAVTYALSNEGRCAATYSFDDGIDT